MRFLPTLLLFPWRFQQLSSPDLSRPYGTIPVLVLRTYHYLDPYGISFLESFQYSVGVEKGRTVSPNSRWRSHQPGKGIQVSHWSRRDRISFPRPTYPVPTGLFLFCFLRIYPCLGPYGTSFLESFRDGVGVEKEETVLRCSR